LKALKFIINSNILIALAAVSLTLATQVQLGMNPQPELYLAIIFFATLLDYNFHRFVTLNSNPENMTAGKYHWAATHLPLLKRLIAVSLAGLGITLLFAGFRIFIFLGLMSILTFLYSIPVNRKPGKSFLMLKIPGLKSLIIAFVWAAATVFLPVLQSGNSFTTNQMLLLFAERLSFIFAITIPFDIRDMKADKLVGLRTIPVAFGEKKARTISNMVLLLSLSIAIFHYTDLNMIFIIPAYGTCIIFILALINSRKLASLPNYYHGLLDGSIILFGILVCLSYFIKGYF
jgi:4-hydroxybenzoate polyprenyltransferase